MAGNITPIFSRVGDIQGGTLLTTAAADYTGNNNNNNFVFRADPNNGGFVQRLRFKAIGTNVASVARIYIVPNRSPNAATISTPAAPTGTAGTTGGSLPTQTFYAKVQAVEQSGAITPFGAESSGTAVTGPTGNVAWSWTAITGAVSYNISIGTQAAGEFCYFTTSTNSFALNSVAPGTPNGMIGTGYLSAINYFYGEISLPATTAIATAATTEIDYPMNIALPPGYGILVGLGTTVAAGWVVTTIGGKY